MFKRVKPGHSKFNEDEDDQINSYTKRSTQNYWKQDDFISSNGPARGFNQKCRPDKENHYGAGGPESQFRDNGNRRGGRAGFNGSGFPSKGQKSLVSISQNPEEA